MYLHVSSGLMSRCVSLAQMYNLMKEHGKKKLTVIWPLEVGCGIGFWEVFDEGIFPDIDLKVIEDRANLELVEKYNEIGGFRKNVAERNVMGIIRYVLLRIEMETEKVKRVNIWMPKYWNKIKGTYIDYIPKSSDDWKNGRHREVVINGSQRLHELLNANKDAFLSVYCTVDIESKKDNYDCIKFKREHWEIVKKIIPLGEKLVGVHIRRTDHTVCIQNSSTDTFVKKMKEICEQEPETKFFLATDDKTEEQHLKEIFGGRILTQANKKWGCANSEEMKSGIVDMLCLASCDYILGSYTSVFSSFSARYGGKDLVICKDT